MALWYTCPVCNGTGADRIREGSGWRLETDPRCTGSGIVTDRQPGDPTELPDGRPQTVPPYSA